MTRKSTAVPISSLKNFSFDLTLAGAVRVAAPTQADAEKLLKERINAVGISFGEGSTKIVGECSLVGEPSVFLIDGEDVDSPKGTPLDIALNMLRETLSVWEGEEESVKDEHDAHIEEIRDVLRSFGDEIETPDCNYD
jgi:hypothetical protein